MNILIIGNGFDVAHGLPTKYSDFLEACSVARDINKSHYFWENNQIALSIGAKKHLNNQKFEILKNIAESLGEKKWNSFIKLSKSYWIDHFIKREKTIGANWLNFEEEIKMVVENLVYEMKYANSEIFDISNTSNGDLQLFWHVHRLDKKPTTYKQLFMKLNEEQEKLVNALGIYMHDYVSKRNIDKKSIIEKRHFDKLLSFNYTTTYEDNYEKDIDSCYIHGKTGKELSGNNMVLGFDDHYIDGAQVIPEMIPFEKYYQRIIKRTDNNYFEWLEKLNDEEKNLIYIFGHSLAPADGDILRQFMLNDKANIDVEIYYYDEVDRCEKVKNLAIILGPDNLIKLTGGIKPVIKFVQK